MSSFQQLSDRTGIVAARAPGRVNLLGEHTDYNEGYVLPTAIPQVTRVEMALSDTRYFEFHSENLHETVKYLPGEDAPQGFGRYIQGCIELAGEGADTIPPVAICISSDVPMGGGLSSSAALEVAVLRALRTMFELRFDDVELARRAQRAEIEYAGVRCGILDQMACSLGDTQHMLFLDTRTLERRILPLPQPADLIVIDSGIPRTLAASGYNRRRAECEEAARILGVHALRDIGDVTRTESLPDPLNRRARHVVTENNRVLEAITGIDVARFGQLMRDSHASLRDDYEVSIAALDQLVALLNDHPDVYGARLTGAGFGGACVALAKAGSSAAVKQHVLQAYADLGYNGSALV
jgi:galactokinase